MAGAYIDVRTTGTPWVLAQLEQMDAEDRAWVEPMLADLAG